MRLAEEKKLSARKTIEELRHQFKELLIQNMQLPEHLRLDRKEFEMDPEIKRELAKHTEEKVGPHHYYMALHGSTLSLHL